MVFLAQVFHRRVQEGREGVERNSRGLELERVGREDVIHRRAEEVKGKLRK